MKNPKIIRLITNVDRPVIALGTKANLHGQCRRVDKLIRRAKNDPELDINRFVAFGPDGVIVHLLAEITHTFELTGFGATKRWRKLRVVRHGRSIFYAVRVVEWEKHPALPGLDLAKEELELLYFMAERLSRAKAYHEQRFDASAILDEVAENNVLRAEELGELDDRRLLDLLRIDPLALRALQAALLACVWSNLEAEELPAFALNFAVVKNWKAEQNTAFLQHFAAVDLFRAPNACYGGPLCVKLDAVKDCGKLSPLYGRLVLHQVGSADIRDRLVEGLRDAARRRALGAFQDEPMPAFPVIVGTAILPEDVAINIVQTKNQHVLTPTEADTLRLAAAHLLACPAELVRTLDSELWKLSRDPRAYAMSTTALWMRAIERTMLELLFDDAQLREEAGMLFGDQQETEREALRARIGKIEEGIDFLLSPDRYADAILGAKPGDEAAFEDAAAFYGFIEGGRALAINKSQLPRLLMRVGVAEELVDDVLEGMKERGIIAHASVPVRIGTATKRVIAIPAKKLLNYSVSAVTGGRKAEDGE